MVEGWAGPVAVSSRNVTPTPSVPPTCFSSLGTQGLPFIISASKANRTLMTLPSSARPATACCTNCCRSPSTSGIVLSRSRWSLVMMIFLRHRPFKIVPCDRASGRKQLSRCRRAWNPPGSACTEGFQLLRFCVAWLARAVQLCPKSYRHPHGSGGPCCGASGRLHTQDGDRVRRENMAERGAGVVDSLRHGGNFRRLVQRIFVIGVGGGKDLDGRGRRRPARRRGGGFRSRAIGPRR